MEIQKPTWYGTYTRCIPNENHLGVEVWSEDARLNQTRTVPSCVLFVFEMMKLKMAYGFSIRLRHLITSTFSRDWAGIQLNQSHTIKMNAFATWHSLTQAQCMRRPLNIHSQLSPCYTPSHHNIHHVQAIFDSGTVTRTWAGSKPATTTLGLLLSFISSSPATSPSVAVGVISAPLHTYRPHIF